MAPDLSDTEIDRICDGLTQHAAKVRYLTGLGLRVDRRPNGRPLVARAEWDRHYATRPGAAQPHSDTGSHGPRWRPAAGA